MHSPLLPLAKAASIFLLMSITSWSQENYTAWKYSKTLLLNTSATGAATTENQMAFPVLVRLTAAQADVFATAQANGADLRFAKANGAPLAYQIERWNAAAQQAEIWVKLDTVLANTDAQTVKMHWGNATATDSSKGAKVFTATLPNGNPNWGGVWHLDGTVKDASGQAPDGQDSGTVDTAGAIGRGRSFENLNAYDTTGGKYIHLGAPASLNIKGAITMEAWVQWRSKLNHRIVVCHGQAKGNTTETVLRVGEYQDYRTGVWNGKVHHAHLNAAPADSNTWVHIAGVHTGAKWILYRNGIAAHDTADTNGAQNSSGSWRIGAQFTGKAISRLFRGSIDEVRISPFARSADWFKLNYATQKPDQTALTWAPSTAIQIPTLKPKLRTGVSRIKTLEFITPAQNHSVNATGKRTIELKP
jgi:hypothetical protein